MLEITMNATAFLPFQTKRYM